MSEWQPIETAPAGKAILVFYKNSYGKPRIIKARYVAKFAELADAYDFEWEDESELDYDESTDKYYMREGWLELIDNWDDYSSVYFRQHLTHWMPLPEPPMEESNEP